MMRSALFFLLCSWALVSCAKPAPEGVVTLTYATAYGAGHPFSQADIQWKESVETASSGSLKIKMHWAGSLLSATESMEEIRHGVSDIGLITPIYTLGGTHLLRTQAGFYSGVSGFEDQLALYGCMSQVGHHFADELDGLKVLAIQGGNNPGIITRDKAVRSLDDLNGMRIRAPSEILPLLRQLGADPVDMPMNEVYSALAKGVIDGVVAPDDTFGSLHFAEVSKFYTDLKVPRGAYPARAMSLKTWNSLSPDHQRVLEQNRTVWQDALAERMLAASSRGKKAAEMAGIEVITISNEDQKKFDELYLQQARQSAVALKSVGIDAQPVFDAARRSIAPDGSVECQE